MHKYFSWIGGALAASAGYVIAHSDQIGTLSSAVASSYPKAAPVVGILGVVLAMAGHSVVPNAIQSSSSASK